MILSYVVLFPGLASFILWIKGISLIGANRSGVFTSDAYFKRYNGHDFKEKFMLYHILGAVFIVTGIVLSNKKVLNA